MTTKGGKLEVFPPVNVYKNIKKEDLLFK